MTRIVVDASVVLKSLAAHQERHEDRARAVMDAWEFRRLDLVAPQLLYLEVLNVGARKWGFGHAAMLVIATALEKLGIEVADPDLGRIADWTELGLTAYDAAYVAVAEAAEIPLVTDDGHIVALAPDVAVPLAAFEPPS